ncbi:MAG TPA: 30S ribosomal protein S6 [Candidatus Paceibacterota bacterium]|nr:30S ribosomal protein S6 [Candidatus Paceibacterota bacterium]
MTDTRRNYELAFHINPNLDEPRIAQISNELKDQVSKAKGIISFTKEPERIRLSYPIRGNANSYFGYIQFSTEETDGLASVEEYIKLNPDIIRSLTVRLPSDAQKSQALMRQAKARERMEKKAKVAPEKAPAVPNEKLDKELEDIIEKL